MADYEKLKELVEDEHGEAHAIVEEHDAELEIRMGQAEWDDDAEAVTLYKFGHPVMTIPADRIIRFYPPQDIWHE